MLEKLNVLMEINFIQIPIPSFYREFLRAIWKSWQKQNRRSEQGHDKLQITKKNKHLPKMKNKSSIEQRPQMF